MAQHFDLGPIRDRLQTLYGKEAEGAAERIGQLLCLYAPIIGDDQPQALDQASAILITYADQVTAPGMPAIQALDELLSDVGLNRVLTHVHFLPFFPYSSDDGFSVINYRQLDGVHGTWSDVQQIATRYDLMFDLVLNHVSAKSDWFQDYLSGKPPYDRFFIESDPATDLSQVTRPRALPLLTSFDTSRGRRHIWTTFSADQVDLNYASPCVLIEMIDVLLFFVAQGASLVRLDAIAYLWKEPGTTCIHLPQTHEVVKLLRDVLAQIAPSVKLITETNVPHRENVSYFGDGDEAHLIYQFSLPPLLLEAMLSADAGALQKWLANLDPPPRGCTFFNFTASHDGIGVRPLEGLVSPERFDRLIAAVRERGGLVGMKRDSAGNESPYELNITYYSALANPTEENEELHVRRFLTTQAVMLALQGVPGVYFHSFVGTQNDATAAAETGIPRRINRRKFSRSQLRAMLADASLPHQSVLDGMIHLLEVRASHAAFHPDARQEVIASPDSRLLIVDRHNEQTRDSVTIAANFSDQPVELTISQPRHELLQDQEVTPGAVTVLPYEVLWLAHRG